MTGTALPILSKTDFLLYCEAPRHLWAARQGQFQAPLSEFALHLVRQGQVVEKLAQDFLNTILIPSQPGAQLSWQQTFTAGPFQARLDALVYKPGTSTFDLYEIKSNTSADKENLLDLAFQAHILQSQVPLGRIYLLHLNKEYARQGLLDLASLFIAEDLTDQAVELFPDVEGLRQQALHAIQETDPLRLAPCTDPKTCPYPDVCHPGLPEYSIYNIPGLHPTKKKKLLSLGILDARDIPADFELNEKQKLVLKVAQTKREHINHSAIRSELEKLAFPLYFLDYETCISAIPLFDGYHPQQQVVFQYSLHILDNPQGKLIHKEHLSTAPGDPTVSLLNQLSQDIQPGGTVIVWNKRFESNMNANMAALHPEFAGFLASVNERMYDLGDIVSLGYYLHPGFKGSWSLKQVLPVMVPELSYEGMPVNHGDQASVAWWNLVFGNLAEDEKTSLVVALLRYCELDTLAMVEVYRRFCALATG